jgi:CrcB protein
VADQIGARRLGFELRELAFVGLGSIPGALLRWQSGMQMGPALGGSAGSDLLVNLLGSFVLGFLAGPMPQRTHLLLFLGIGFCGSLTTFSSWMLDVARLIQAGDPLLGLLLMAGSLMGGLGFALAGLSLSRRLFRRTAG